MKTIVVRDPVRQGYDIFVQVMPGRYYGPHDSAGFADIVDVGPGENPPVFLHLGEEIAWAIAQGIIEGEASERPSRDTVNDAREVRDRMITLVENVVNSQNLKKV